MSSSFSARARLYSPLFEARFGVHIYSGMEETKPAGWRFGPAPLHPGKLSFRFAERGGFWAEIEGRKNLFRQGDLMILRPGEVCSLWSAFGRPHTAIGLGFAVSQGEEDNILLHREFRHHHVLRHPAEIRQAFRRVLGALAESSALRDLAVAAALLELTERILRETRSPVRRAPELRDRATTLTRSAQAWALANLARPFRLAEWAAAVGTPSSFFEHTFCSLVGMPPKKWVKEQRMRLARQQLLATSLPVKSVGLAAGYRDPLFFSRDFRMHFGFSPVRFRKKHARAGR
ncbi:MAG: helix-turn-helix transcriptional regulator [Verrucomicrobiae bacterium]|nr:helix-turn-helix transcriptional regulator [Verrucomicrobiae bacterium]